MNRIIIFCNQDHQDSLKLSLQDHQEIQIVDYVFDGLEVLRICSDDLQNALEAGAIGFFLKGIKAPKLREAIKNAMNGITTIEKEVYII